MPKLRNIAHVRHNMHEKTEQSTQIPSIFWGVLKVKFSFENTYLQTILVIMLDIRTENLGLSP